MLVLQHYDIWCFDKTFARKIIIQMKQANSPALAGILAITAGNRRAAGNNRNASNMEYKSGEARNRRNQ
jgi:hypothetical protein